MSARQLKPMGEKQPRPLQILVYTPETGGTKGAPQTSEVFDVGGSSKSGAGGNRTLEFTNRNGETLRIPEYTTHIIRPSPPYPSSRKAMEQYHQPGAATPAAPIYHHNHHPCPERFLHLYPSYQEPILPLPPAPYPIPIPPPPQQPPEFAMTTMTIPPITEEEWNMIISPEFPPEEMLGPDQGPPAVEELLETCPPVDSTDEGKQWWYELLRTEVDEEGFWTRFLGGDGGVMRGEAGWDGSGEGETMGGYEVFVGDGRLSGSGIPEDFSI